VAERLSGEAALDDPERLEGAPEPLVERDSESAEFLDSRTDADRQIDPAARNIVEDCDVLCHAYRVMEG